MIRFSEISPPSPRRAWAPWAAVAALAVVLYGWAPLGVPGGYFADEPSIALNAACVAATGADEYGVSHPLFFRAFGEYKQPVYIYLLSALYRIWRPSLDGARLFSMALGLFAVAVFLHLARSAGLGEPTRRPWFVALGASFCLLSPWLLVIARFPVECTLVPLVGALQALAVHRLLATRRFAWALADGALVGLGVYVYHPLKIVPLAHFFLLGAIALSRVRREPRLLALCAVAALAAATAMGPFVADLFGAGHSLARYHAVGGHLDARTLARLYFVHFNPVFLFLRGDANLRHHLGLGGELNLVFLPLLLGGAVEAGRRAWRGDPFALHSLLLPPLCLLPASLSADGVPHALRTNVALVPLWTLALFGAVAAWRFVEGRRARRAVALAVIALGAAEAVAQVAWYQTRYPRAGAAAWFGPPALRAAEADCAPLPGDNHSGYTVFKRFYRVARGDVRYCGGR